MEIKALLKKNESIKNQYVGKQCYILLEDTSSSEVSKALKSDSVLIAVSGIAKTISLSSLSPHYWVYMNKQPHPRADSSIQEFLKTLWDDNVISKIVAPLSIVSTLTKLPYFVNCDMHFYDIDQNVTNTSEIDISQSLPPSLRMKDRLRSCWQYT